MAKKTKIVAVQIEACNGLPETTIQITRVDRKHAYINPYPMWRRITRSSLLRCQRAQLAIYERAKS